jgi:hypothetical protein
VSERVERDALQGEIPKLTGKLDYAGRQRACEIEDEAEGEEALAFHLAERECQLRELVQQLKVAIEERDKAFNALRDVDRCLEKVIQSSIRLTVRAEINAARYAIRAVLSKPAGPQEEKP